MVGGGIMSVCGAAFALACVLSGLCVGEPAARVGSVSAEPAVVEVSSGGGGASVSADEGTPVSEEASRTPDLGASVTAYGSGTAHDGGALVLWEPGYYIAHDWSVPGAIISSLSAGDVFSVDGSTYVVTGVSTFPQDVKYEVVRDTVGWDALCLQTCVGGTGVVRVAYVSGAGWFPEYVDDAGVWGDRESHTVTTYETVTVEEYVPTVTTYETVSGTISRGGGSASVSGSL